MMRRAKGNMRASCLFLVVAGLALLCVSPAAGSLDRLRRFQRECFPAIPCVMTLGRDSAYGCGQCTEDSVTEQVSELLQAEELRNFLGATGVERRFLLIPEILFFSYSFLGRLPFSNTVAGVVVYDGFDRDEDPGVATRPEAFSADGDIPNKEFSVTKFRYNQLNQSVAPQFQFFPFNIFRVNSSVAARIRERAKKFARDPREADDDATTGTTGSGSGTGTVSTTGGMHPSYVLQSNGRMFACPRDAKKQQQDETSPNPGRFKPLNSSRCLEDRTCFPVGGQSVWSSLDVLLPNPDNKKILAITAPLDSTAFFHDLAQGAAAEIASLATMMAVAETVGEYHRTKGKGKEMLRQPVYFAWNAQSWGFSGSSRFLQDVKEFKCREEANASGLELGCKKPYKYTMRFKDFDGADWSVLNLASIIDPKQSGDNTTGSSTNETMFYIHGQIGAGDGSVRRALLGALADAGIEESRLNKSVPPDASQSFFQIVGSEVETVSLAGYDAEFTNKVFHSQFDNVSLIPVDRRDRLNVAAEGIARAVISLSYGDEDPVIDVKNGTINAFIQCLTSNWSAVPCELSREYQGEERFESGQNFVSAANYAGIFVPRSRQNDMTPSAFFKTDLIRSFLAFHNRFDEGQECKKDGDCNGSFIANLNKNATTQSELRVAHCSRGKCVASDTFLHDAYGTGIDTTSAFGAEKAGNEDSPQFEVNREKNRIVNESAPQFPQFTESHWDADLGLCGLTRDSESFGFAILFGGVGLNVFSFIVAWVLRRSLLPRKAEDPEPEEEAEVPLAV